MESIYIKLFFFSVPIKRNVIILVVLAGGLLQLGCKKLVEVPPPSTRIAENNVYTNDITAIAVLTGVYIDMNKAGTVFTGNRSISLFSGLSADELILNSGMTINPYVNYYTNNLSASEPSSGSEHWSSLYNFIFRCNAAIEGLTSPGSSLLTPAVKQQLLGEAKFMRSFYYFYLVNLYGAIPMPLSTDYKVNTLLPRSKVSEVYQQIIQDLKDAIDLLSDTYLDVSLLKKTTEKVRPTKWAASALLARAYLFTGDYSNAEAQSTIVVNNNSLFGLPALNSAFLKNSKEAIWQLQGTEINFNTEDARTFIITSAGPTISPDQPVYLSTDLLNNFEANDLRKESGNWVDSIDISGTTYHFPYKYKLNSLDNTIDPTTGTTNMKEYLMVLRTGEQYLIRAEARTQQNNLTGAQDDLNRIRSRSGLDPVMINDKPSLLAAILQERRVELFTEWGHRWFDLKRTNQIDPVMEKITPLKSGGNPWRPYQKLYPIPQADLSRSPNLIQNDGY